MSPERRRQHGMTLIELMVAVVLGLIVMLAMGILFVDSHKGWLHAWEYVYGDIPSDAKVTDRAFDRIVRRSSQSAASVDPDGQWAEVHYYQTDASNVLDGYTKFYLDGTELKMERGELGDTPTVTGTDVLAENVSSVTFVLVGAQIQMRMELDNGRVQTVMTSSAVMHNK